MFNLESLTVLPSLLVGGGVASLLWALFDKRAGGVVSTVAGISPSSEELQKLRAELATAQDEADKVPDLHSYTRQLEKKIQILEAATAEPGSEEHEMRVKVLEQQLSEKAELESKLAVAIQERDDYKARAEMFDSVVGTGSSTATAPPAEVVAPVAEPVAKAEPVPVAPIVEAPAVPLAEVPAAQISIDPPVEILAPKSEQVQAPVPEVVVSPIQPVVTGGAAAAAKLEPMEPEPERPALRVEVNEPAVAVAVADNRDPLENIDGIGPVYQQKLYEAGIKTFAQLAAASPSRITEVIEPQNWQMIDVMKWRREAALYAAGEKS